MAPRPRDHAPVIAADNLTVVGCTGCAWQPTFTPKDWRPSRVQFDAHLEHPGAATPHQALVGSLSQLLEEWDSWCHEHCAACRNPDPDDTPWSQRRAHDCGITRREVAEQVRGCLKASWS
jgi:hypothetical protein